MSPTHSLTGRQVRRCINLLYAGMASWSVFGAAVTGSLLTGLLLSLKMSNQQIAVVMSLTLWFLPMQMLGSLLQARFFHRQKFWLSFAFIHYTAFLVLALMAWFWGSLPAAAAALVFMIIFALSHASAQLTGSITLAWQGEIIPPRESNSFWTKRTSIQMVSTMLSGIALGFLADLLGRDKSTTYAVILVIGVLFAWFSLFLHTFIPDPTPYSEDKVNLRDIFHSIIAEKNFRQLALFFSVQSFAAWTMCGFIFVYLQRNMNFSQGAIQILLSASYIVSFFAAFLFKFFGNRYGRKPLLIICTVLKCGEFIVWGSLLPGNNWLDQLGLHGLLTLGLDTSFIPPGFIGALPVFIIGGFINIGLTSGQLSLLTSIGKKNTQSFMIAFFFMLVGLAGAVSSSFSGSLYNLIEASSLPQTYGLNTFNILALIGAAGYLLSTFFIFRYQEHGAAPTATVVRSLFGHNPFRAIYHAHVLGTPLSELQRADTIRQARGGLINNQLLLGLRSPSALVRDSAIQNIAGSGDQLDHELELELIALLDSVKLGMRQQAANTLGKLRNRKALNPLLAGSISTDPDFANACIYALGHLPSPETITVMREILLDHNRLDNWAAAAETLSRISTFQDAEVIFMAYENESEWILSRQCLLSLCRVMCTDNKQIQKYFDGEENQPGSQIELLLRNLTARQQLPMTFDDAITRYEQNKLADLLESILLAELPAWNITADTLEQLFINGTSRFRCTALDAMDFRAIRFRLRLKLWSYLRFEGNEPDTLKMLAALILTSLDASHTG